MSTFDTRQGVGTYARRTVQVGLLGRMDLESAGVGLAARALLASWL